MDSDAAFDILGLDRDADLDAVKHRFRTLVHARHPDRGGDPRAFHDLQLAYRLLCRELDAHARDARPPRPRVARGRPSRLRHDPPATPVTPASSEPVLPLTLSEVLSLRTDRHHALDTELLTRLLLTGPPTGHGYRLLSRAPGRRSTRLPQLLGGIGVASSLTISILAAGAHIELAARGRRARRMLSVLDPGGLTHATWTRHRGDAVTVAAADIDVTARSEPGARRLVAAVVELLDALGWPLGRWRIEPGARSAAR